MIAEYRRMQALVTLAYARHAWVSLAALTPAFGSEAETETTLRELEVLGFACRERNDDGSYANRWCLTVR